MTQSSSPYVLGDVASFLSRKSTGKLPSEITQNRLQALFESPYPSTSVQRKKNDTPVQLPNQMLEDRKNDSAISKSRKRYIEESMPVEQQREENFTNRPRKRQKEEPRSSSESPAVKNVKTSSLNESKDEKLSKNELNAKRRVELKLKKKISEVNVVKNQRTVFIGNVALTVSKKSLIKLFSPCGKVEAVRIRSAPVAVKKLPRKALVIKKDFDPSRHNMNVYVIFETEDAAKKSLDLNGVELDGLHIRVDMAGKTEKHDSKKTIFIGNLPFSAEEELVRKHFEVCGKVENVRLVRNKVDGLGKGFGYVKFSELSSVTSALSLNGEELLGRALRVKKAAKKPKKSKVKAAEKKTKSGQNGKRSYNTSRIKRPHQIKSEKSVQRDTAASAAASKKTTRKPLKKFGDVKNRLQSMKTSSEAGRKEKHELKKALRQIVREKKTRSLGKLLTN